MTPKQKGLLARIRLALWGLVVVAAIAAAASYFIRLPPEAAGPAGKPFTLEATDGTTFTQADLKGEPTLLFFGYTFCPDVCPTTLAELAGYREQLDLAPSQLRIIFASVDPERDTVDVLKNYLSGFGTPILGLTGTPAEVDQVKAAFGIYSEKGDDDGKGNYVVNHTATVFLLDADGQLRSTIDYAEQSRMALAKIKRLVGT